MIQPNTKLTVADNTGVKVLICIQPIAGARNRGAGIGDIIVASARSVSPRSSVKKKEVVRAVVVRTRFGRQRADNTVIRFDDNAAVIINPDKTPRGSRIFGPVARELRDKGYPKIISQALEVW